MKNVIRISTEGRTGLIKWIEDNFDDIEEFVATFKLKDGSTMTMYDVISYFNAAAICNIQNDVIHTLARDEELILKDE